MTPVFGDSKAILSDLVGRGFANKYSSGHHIEWQTSDGTASIWVRYRIYGQSRLDQKTWLDLCEAAALARMCVHEMKLAIRSGELRAERRGWLQIYQGDLQEYLHQM